jgi:hypothetical protein
MYKKKFELLSKKSALILLIQSVLSLYASHDAHIQAGSTVTAYA